MRNSFKISGDTVIIRIETHTKSGRKTVTSYREAIIDLSDLDRVMEITGYWMANTKNNPYVYGPAGVGMIHRWIMEPPIGLVVDHINHDTFDNRRCNLRVCTSAENTRNKKLSPRNKSGISGVRRNGSKWTAGIGVDMKYVHLGTFSTIEGAIKARKDAEIKYFGEFRPKTSK